MPTPENHEDEIVKLKKELAEKEELLAFTRSYADELLGQVNIQVENIQIQQNLLQHQHRQLVDSIECARHVLATVTTSLSDLQEAYKESFIIFQPKDLIGGDFFWMHTIGDKIFMAVGDCTGHGVSGGILSLMGDMLLRQAVIEHQMQDPSEILHHIDQAVEGMKKIKGALASTTNITSDIAIDMLVSVHHTTTNQLYLSSAHMPFYIWENTCLNRVKGNGGSIGVAKTNKKFKTIIHQLQPDTIIYYTTDGFPDQFKHKESEDHKTKKFGRTQLLDLFENHASCTAAEQHKGIMNTFLEWKQDAPQTDDVMLIGIHYDSVNIH